MKKINLNDLDIQVMNMLEMKEQNGGNSGAVMVGAVYLWFSAAAALLAVSGSIIYGPFFK